MRGITPATTRPPGTWRSAPGILGRPCCGDLVERAAQLLGEPAARRRRSRAAPRRPRSRPGRGPSPRRPAATQSGAAAARSATTRSSSAARDAAEVEAQRSTLEATVSTAASSPPRSTRPSSALAAAAAPLGRHRHGVLLDAPRLSVARRGARHRGDARSRAPTPTPPDGWYPDPSGAAQWRRWDGAAWGAATLPYGPPPPSASTLLVERSAWQLLRVVAPWGLLAPACPRARARRGEPLARSGAPLPAHVAWDAALQHRPLPQAPAATGAGSGAVSTTILVVWLVTIVGIGAWLRFVARVLARRRRGHVSTPTGACVDVPLVLHPLRRPRRRRDARVAAGCPRATRRAGVPVDRMGARRDRRGARDRGLDRHARRPRRSPRPGASPRPAPCAWVAAAVELPKGLEAIADDHASLGVRRAPAPS